MFPTRNAVVPVLSALLSVPGALAAENMAVYNGALGGVPHDSPCWEYVTNANFTAPTNVNGATTLGPTTNGGRALWVQSLVPFSFADGASITASVKIISSSYYAANPYRRSGYYLTLVDKNSKLFQIGISSDRVLLHTADQNWSDQTYLFNTTDAFHTYKLDVQGTTARVYIDGNLVLTDTLSSYTPSSDSQVSFGDTSTLANSNSLTAWVVVEGIPDCTAGDLNCDGIVDGTDLGILLGAWNTDACAADLNHDLIVDGSDLGILLGNWG